MFIEVKNKSKLPLPNYKTKGSAGLDLHADIYEPIIIKPFERKLIPTGLFMSIPEGYEGQIRARSGLALNYGITLANGVGTIDSDYRGELKVILINLSDKPFTINRGDRVAQLVFIEYKKVQFKEVNSLTDTTRGLGGFGHTGV